MELMSSLLFCAVLLPTILGLVLKTDSEQQPNTFIRTRNKTITHKKLLLNLNGMPLVNVVSELQSVFNDFTCKQCTECMERAVKAYIINQHIVNIRPNHDDFQNDVLNEQVIYNREKRDINNKLNITKVNKVNKLKPKKNKANRSVTVTKYDVDGDVYALKVHEANIVDKDYKNTSNCHVYSIKKTFHCETPEAVAVVTTRRKKANKTKKIKEKTVVVSPSKTLFMFRKKSQDDFQVPENFRTSLEEFD